MGNLEDIISRQNPNWRNRDVVPIEMSWPRREDIVGKITPWLDKRLIVALTGLRRIGKSTILNQIRGDLLKTVNPNFILTFSFEKSEVRYHQDSLRKILNYFFDVILQTAPQQLTEKVYIFLDEVQYIPFWQDVVKTYYDFNPNIKFFVSGSTSLFIRQKALESLAGRIMEIVVPPLTFSGYLTIGNKGLGDIDRNFRFNPDLVNAVFEEYLAVGQFPEPVKENYLAANVSSYLSLIEEKIVEQDIPKLYSVERVDILKLIFNYCQNNASSILEYQNLAGDLGVDSKLTARYLEYLEKAYLLSLCLNVTKKPVRSSRTGKKVYLGSTNMSLVGVPQKAENHVFNYLKSLGEVKFYRYKNFEVDFVLKKDNWELPVEVKYQEKIAPPDYRNLVKLAQMKKAGKALLVSKKAKDQVVVDGVTVDIVPAVLLENYRFLW